MQQIKVIMFCPFGSGSSLHMPTVGRNSYWCVSICTYAIEYWISALYTQKFLLQSIMSYMLIILISYNMI